MLQEYDVVASLVDRPEVGVVRGHSGTIVLVLAPGVFEVDFIDEEGQQFAQGPFRAEELLKLVSTRPVAAEAA